MSDDDLVRPGLTTGYKQEIPNIKRKLRQKVKPLDFNDVRRARLPYADAIVFELFEAGFPMGANYFKELIEFEKNMKIPEGKIIKKMADSKFIMDKISGELVKAELERRSENRDREIQILLNLANLMSNQHKDLNWMVDQLYIVTLEEAETYKSDGGLLEARGCYFYGTFLTVKQNLYDEAINIFARARNLCRGHADWTISETDYRYIMNEICSKYYVALLQKAQGLRIINPNEAFDLIKNAIKLAIESDVQRGIAECYIEQGKIYIELGNLPKGIEAFYTALKHSQLSADPNLTCENYLQLAIGRKKENDYNGCGKYLKIMRKIAEGKHLHSYVGESLILQGQINLYSGRAKEASEDLKNAVEIFNELNLKEKLSQARSLAAIASGQQIINPFIETVLKSDKQEFGNNPYMSKLLEWKFTRKPFWECSDNLEGFQVSTTDTTFSVQSKTDTILNVNNPFD